MPKIALPLWQPTPTAVTHLDPLETPVEPNTLDPLRESVDTDIGLRDHFRHSGWRHDRLFIYGAFRDLNVAFARKEAFRMCGTSWWVLRHRTDRQRFRLVPDHCHDRFCLPCGHTRQATIRENAHRLIRDYPHRFLTLTIRNTGQPLNELLNRLYTAFRKLRQRSLWKHRVAGGAAFCEITFNEAGSVAPNGRVRSTDEWNPHLHCILDGRYIDRPDLSRAWLAVTGDSFNVKIKLIRTKRAVVEYVTKYATKPLPHDVIARAAPLREAILALRRRRLVVTFGTWKRWRLLDNPADDAWECYEHFEAVSFRACRGDTLCKNVMAMMHSADPFTGEFYVADDGPALEDSS